MFGIVIICVPSAILLHRLAVVKRQSQFLSNGNSNSVTPTGAGLEFFITVRKKRQHVPAQIRLPPQNSSNIP
jgi:hypothetical protein